MRFRFIDLREYAGLVPGLLISLVVSLAAARRVARALATSPLLAWATLMSIGVILSVTATPSREAITEGTGTPGAFCDFSRLGLIPLNQLFAFREPSLNVLLYLPLGIAIGLLPQSRAKVVLVVIGFAMPFAIEAIQGLAPGLGRVCESADVIDNLTGLTVGLVGGWLAGAIVNEENRPPDGPDDVA